MSTQQVIEAIVGAAIAFVVPAALNQFWPPPPPTRSLPWLRWCISGLIGGAIGIVASIMLGFAGLAGAGLGSLAVFGALIGLFQWVALRGYLVVGTWFVVASATGWMFFLLGNFTWGWLSVGAAVGLMQYLSLTSHKGALWWIPGNLIAWPVAGAMGFYIGTLIFPIYEPLAWVVGFGVVGLVGAVILLVPLSRLGKG